LRRSSCWNIPDPIKARKARDRLSLRRHNALTAASHECDYAPRFGQIPAQAILGDLETTAERTPPINAGAFHALLSSQ
jgi:hypothetical protein